MDKILQDKAEVNGFEEEVYGVSASLYEQCAEANVSYPTLLMRYTGMGADAHLLLNETHRFPVHSVLVERMLPLLASQRRFSNTTTVTGNLRGDDALAGSENDKHAKIVYNVNLEAVFGKMLGNFRTMHVILDAVYCSCIFRSYDWIAKELFQKISMLPAAIRNISAIFLLETVLPYFCSEAHIDYHKFNQGLSNPLSMTQPNSRFCRCIIAPVEPTATSSLPSGGDANSCVVKLSGNVLKQTEAERLGCWKSQILQLAASDCDTVAVTTNKNDGYLVRRGEINAIIRTIISHFDADGCDDYFDDKKKNALCNYDGYWMSKRIRLLNLMGLSQVNPNFLLKLVEHENVASPSLVFASLHTLSLLTSFPYGANEWNEWLPELPLDHGFFQKTTFSSEADNELVQCIVAQRMNAKERACYEGKGFAAAAMVHFRDLVKVCSPPVAAWIHCLEGKLEAVDRTEAPGICIAGGFMTRSLLWIDVIPEEKEENESEATFSADANNDDGKEKKAGEEGQQPVTTFWFEDAVENWKRGDMDIFVADEFFHHVVHFMVEWAFPAGYRLDPSYTTICLVHDRHTTIQFLRMPALHFDRMKDKNTCILQSFDLAPCCVLFAVTPEPCLKISFRAFLCLFYEARICFNEQVHAQSDQKIKRMQKYMARGFRYNGPELLPVPGSGGGGDDEASSLHQNCGHRTKQEKEEEVEEKEWEDTTCARKRRRRQCLDATELVDGKRKLVHELMYSSQAFIPYSNDFKPPRQWFCIVHQL
jgi:hypothetical protein